MGGEAERQGSSMLRKWVGLKEAAYGFGSKPCLSSVRDPWPSNGHQSAASLLQQWEWCQTDPWAC